MEEFVNGYMKIHTLSNGQRRWSRKVSSFQTVGLEDLERLRMNMELCMEGGNSKKPPENEPKQRKDSKPPTPSAASKISRDKDAENKDRIQDSTKTDEKWVGGN